MDADIQILMVKQDGEDGVIVNFSDGTFGAYVVEELLELRPCREPIEKPVDSDKPITTWDIVHSSLSETVTPIQRK